VKTNSPTNLRTFLIVWAGQLVSTLGSQMTTFAISIWAWELTGQATPLVLIGLFTHIPTIIAATFAGVLIDRWNRKSIMMLGDAVAGLSTIAILILLWTQHLAIWHLYLAGVINGLFGYLQSLAASASMAMIVPKQHYTRASALTVARGYGAEIAAPAIAGFLYLFVGLSGILVIDVVTFLIAIATLLSVTIPQPSPSPIDQQRHSWRSELTFGFRYVWHHPSLLAVLLFLLISNLIGSMGSIYSPMILARSGGNAAVLGAASTASGIGGLLGAAVLSLWGGTQRHIHGLLLGNALANFSEMIAGLGRGLLTWITAGFFGAFFSPWSNSANQAIWVSKVQPDVQGKVFATRYFMAQIASPLGLAIAGPLADRVFEPAMMPGGRLAGLFGGMFGTGPGAGMALQYSLSSLCCVVIALSGYAFRVLRDVDKTSPNYG
jgi:MFS transporter, DHA3 family, macrolide efflux protein